MATYGERAVGLDFNPSGSGDVYRVKSQFADIIDQMHELREDPSADPDVKRYAAIAITETQAAQMWCVKALTFKP